MGSGGSTPSKAGENLDILKTLDWLWLLVLLCTVSFQKLQLMRIIAKSVVGR